MRIEVDEHVYVVVTVLEQCDPVMELTAAHACCMYHCTNKRSDSGEVYPVLHCSARELVVPVVDESTGEVLRKLRTRSCSHTCRYFTHT